VRSATLASAVTEEDHAQGPADAAITLVQYGDYECPYTRLSRHSVHQLQREFPEIRFVPADVVNVRIPSHHDPDKLARMLMKHIWEA